MTAPEDPVASAARRPRDAPGYNELRSFKKDLAAVVGTSAVGGDLSYEAIAGRANVPSTDTVWKALNPDSFVVPGDRTIRSIALAFDPEHETYWLNRRSVVLKSTRTRSKVSPAPEAMQEPAVQEPAVQEPAAQEPAAQEPSASSPRRAALRWSMGALAVVAVGTLGYSVTIGSRSNDPESTKVETRAADYADPQVAGCVTSNTVRILTEPIEDVGFVSLVYSPTCRAYWARAERTDNDFLGNRIEVQIRDEDSERLPATADDPGHPVIYTPLLNSSGAGNFCVTATIFSAGGSVERSSSEVCGRG